MNDRPNLPTDTNLRSKYFSYRHLVSFEETNVVGNVYFARHVAWQGRCREMFLGQHAPQILDEIKHGFSLVTIRVNIEYIDELMAFDEVEIRMYLNYIKGNRIGVDFDYLKYSQGSQDQVAYAFQEIGCMRNTNGRLIAVPPPDFLSEALHPYLRQSLQGQNRTGARNKDLSSNHPCDTCER